MMMSLDMMMDSRQLTTTTPAVVGKDRDPWFDGLDVVPSYLDFRDSVDLNISSELHDLIKEIDYKHEKWTDEQLHRDLQAVLSWYREEKGDGLKGGRRRPDEQSLLALLFWEVTKRTKMGKKGKMIPFWDKDWLLRIGTPDSTYTLLDEVPQYLTEYRGAVDLDISSSLRERINGIDRTYESLTDEQLYKELKSIVASYEDEKKDSRCPDKLGLLAMLFWEVTKRTKIGINAGQKGKRIPFWGKDRFNILSILGEAEPEVAAISWRLMGGVGLPSKIAGSTVVELYRIVKLIAKERGLPQKQVYEDAIRVCKEHDTTGKTGLNLVTSGDVQNAILAHFGLPPLPPKGSRQGNRRDSVPPSAPPPSIETLSSNPPGAIPEAEATLPTLPSSTPEPLKKGKKAKAEKPAKVKAEKPEPGPIVIPEMAPVKVKRKSHKKKPPEELIKPSRATYDDEQRVTKELRALVNELIDLRTSEIPSGQRGLVQEITSTMFENALAYLNSRCSRIMLEQKASEGVSKHNKALEDRARYEAALRSEYFLGPSYELKPKEVVDYDRVLKKLYIGHAKNYHPDHHPEHSAKWLQLQEVNEILVTYTETHSK